MEENQGTIQNPGEASEQQKMLTQEQVNAIVAREKSKAAESARRESEERYQRELEAINATRNQQTQRNAEVPRDVDANAIYQQVQERFNREMKAQRDREYVSQVAQNYVSKVAQGKANYQDFEEVTKDFDPTQFPQLTFLLSGIDNAGDVLYELAKNPTKIAQVDLLAQRSPKMAQNELIKLATSINANKQAQAEAQNQNVPDTLDRLQPSRVAGSNGKMSFRELKQLPWLKG